MAVVSAGTGIVYEVLARAFALVDDRRDGTDDRAVTDLVAAAGGNAHVLGRVRDRCELVAREQPRLASATVVLDLVTEAWIAAISVT
jgi:hypothetical protein